MSFKFFRPWEDRGNVGTHQKTDLCHGTPDKTSQMTKPPTVHVASSLQPVQCNFSSGTTVIQPQDEVETPGFMSHQKSAGGIASDVNSSRPSPPLTERSNKVDPWPVLDSSVSSVTPPHPTCDTRSVFDDGIPGKGTEYNGLQMINNTSKDRNSIWKSSGQTSGLSRCESLATLTLTHVMQTVSKQEDAISCTPLIPYEDLNICGASSSSSTFSSSNALNVQATIDLKAGARVNLTTVGHSKLVRSHSLVNNEEAHNGCHPSKGTNSEQSTTASSRIHRKDPHHSKFKCFKCTECWKSFSLSSNLHRHERIHTGSRPFQCRFCEKAFTQASILHAHERIHTGSKPFQCRFCEKAFSQASSLHRHERIHTGSKPFTCRICGKASRSVSNLHEHERIHTGSKPFTCRICGKAFRSVSNLHTHERIHTGSKLFQCRICDKAFSRSSSLHRHERIHTGSKPFQSRFCEKAFSQSGHLCMHEHTHTS